MEKNEHTPTYAEAASHSLQNEGRDATVLNIPPTLNPMLNDALIQQEVESTEMGRELRRLQSINLPGVLEQVDANSTNTRRPTYPKARFIYEEARRVLNSKLLELDAQNYLNRDPETLDTSVLRTRYRKLRQKEQVFLSTAEDLAPIYKKRA